MTDKEIIRALECCISSLSCAECPYHNVISCSIERDALDLIKRQQAEIERLQGYNENLQTANTALSNEILDIKSEAIKEFAESIKAEIREALKSNYKAKSERMAKPNVDMADEFISYCEGKIAALRGIDDFVDTLISSETKTAETDFPKDYSYGY